MKKTLAIIIALLIAFALIGPKFAGNVFNQKIDEYVAAVNEQGVYKMKVTTREQSWFASSAAINLQINMGAMAQQDDIEALSANFQINAQHGPVLTNNGFGIGWIDWALTLVVDELPTGLSTEEEGPIYSAQGQMGLLGATSYQDRILGFNYADPSIGMVFSSNGWQGEGHFSQSAMMYEGGPSNMQMSLPDTYTLDINALQVSWNADVSIIDMLNGNFYNGGASFLLGELELDNLIDQSKAQLSKLNIISTVDFDRNTGLADSATNMTLASFTLADLALKDTVMKLEINNMQQAFFNAYQQMNKDIMDSPERAQAIMQEIMQTHLLGQLKAEPEFNITQLDTVLNGGSLTFNSNTQLVGITALPDTLENNRFWLEHLASSAQMKVDESAALYIANTFIKSQLAGNPQLAEMEPEQLKQVIEQQSLATINSMIQQGLLEKTEGGYSMSFNMTDGKATLNNQPMPLPM